MTKIRKDGDQNFTILSNSVIRDETLSWKARGLFEYLWSLPEDWEFYETEITKHATDGRDSTRSGLDELEEHGYLSRTRERNEKGQVKSAIWILHENPKKPVQEKPVSENPNQGNPTLLNTNSTKHLPNKTRTKDIGQAEPDDIPYKEIIDYLNKKTNRPKNKYFKASSKTNRKLIHARWKEGYRLKDFKEVINNKCFSWMNNPEMFDYLRPSTLFGPKFDQYLKEMHIPSNATPYDLKDFENQKLPQDDDLPF